jgi:hypothetical protein
MPEGMEFPQLRDRILTRSTSRDVGGIIQELRLYNLF